jgi:ribosomal protein S18 acetylase RimI-like enzyme
MTEGVALKEPDNNNYELTQAVLTDLPGVKAVIQEAADYKLSQGDDIWGAEPFSDDEVTSLIETGNLFVVKIGGEVASSVLLLDADTRIWGEEGEDGTAMYIHRLCVADAFRSQGLGTETINLVANFAQKSGKTQLRLDCPYDNQQLCNYYIRNGFQEVRRYDRQQSQGGRNKDKDVYHAGLFQKDITKGAVI